MTDTSRSVRRRIAEYVGAPLREAIIVLKKDLSSAQEEIDRLNRDVDCRDRAIDTLRHGMDQMHHYCAVCYGARSYYPRYGDTFTVACGGRVHDLVTSALQKADKELDEGIA